MCILPILLIIVKSCQATTNKKYVHIYINTLLYTYIREKEIRRCIFQAMETHAVFLKCM